VLVSLGNTMRTVELNVSCGWRTWVMWAMFVLETLKLCKCRTPCSRPCTSFSS
jgi:hypothetical protein